MVTKYNRPIALLVSIDDWNRLLGVRETSFTRLSFDAAVAPGACVQSGWASCLGFSTPAVYASRPPARRLQLMSRRTQMTDVHAKLPLP